MLICLNTVAPQSADERETMEQCIARLANGDAAAMEPLYNIANAAVYAFALSMLKNRHDAEEAAQDCFVKAYAGAGTYRPQGKPMAWLITITRNICLDRLRERAKHAHAPMEDWESYVEQAAVSSEDRLVLEQCMNALDDAERQIVVLHAVGGMKHRETAHLMGMTLTAVLSKYSRAIKKLKANIMQTEDI